MDKRQHILNAMQELIQQGRGGTASVSDIARQAGIAKGGLYYYFHSKEEVMDALVDRQYSHIIAACKAIVKESRGNALEKMMLLLASYRNFAVDDKIDAYLHTPDNAAIHQKSLSVILTSLSPILAGILAQGVQEGLFVCAYPEEYAHIVLSVFTFLLDPGIFDWTGEEYVRKMKALACMLEGGLCAETGSFSFLFAGPG